MCLETRIRVKGVALVVNNRAELGWHKAQTGAPRGRLGHWAYKGHGLYSKKKKKMIKKKNRATQRAW